MVNNKKNKIKQNFLISSTAIIVLLGAICTIWLKKKYCNSNISIVRLEQKLFKTTTKKEIKQLLKAQTTFSEHFLQYNQDNKNKEKIIDLLYNMVQDKNIQKLYKEVQKIYENIDDITKKLNQAFSNIKKYYPNYTIPQIITFITGMEYDLYVDEKIIVIGLDFFLGKEGKYRPNLPQYLLRQFTPEALVVYILKQVVQKNFLKQEASKYLIDEMVYYGKIYYFIKKIHPQEKESILMGYTQKQVERLNCSQKELWTYFIANQLFYTTNATIKKKYIDESPFTLPISQECPGKIGQWIGFKLVSQYAKQHKKNIANIMMHSHAQEILENAHYNPQ